jgi:tRNA pseudouridine38-40 synthase
MASMPQRKQGGESGQRSRNICLTLAFDGSEYHGWQIQRNQPTIQALVSEGIRKITGETVNLVGSGRTDAGTHARAFVANFITATSLSHASLARALNGLLPGDIRVLSARPVPLNFHARRSARSKTYRYQIYRGKVMPPHLARDHYHYPYPVDLELMRRGAKSFEGTHDFASLAAFSGRAVKDTVRRVYYSDLKKAGHRLLYTAEADGFLHHMVRNMVGTLLELGRGRMNLNQLGNLFASRNRDLAGFTAPAHGLVLLRVRYGTSRGQGAKGSRGKGKA